MKILIVATLGTVSKRIIQSIYSLKPRYMARNKHSVEPIHNESVSKKRINSDIHLEAGGTLRLLSKQIIKDLFQDSSFTKKRESISNLFTSQKYNTTKNNVSLFFSLIDIC
jgi:hypothetical protein